MQFSRNYRTGISLSIVLAATVAPSAFGIIQIDDYSIDGVPSADVLNDPDQPYAHAYDYFNGGGDTRDLAQQETNAALGGWRELDARTVVGSGGHMGNREAIAGVIGYGSSAQQGLNLSVYKDPLLNDTFVNMAPIAYGSDNSLSSRQLDLDLIEFLNGRPLSAGSFQLNLKSFTASGAISGNIRIGLLLSSNPSGGPIEEQEVIQVFTTTNVASISWNFTEFSPTILQETDLIQLTLYSGNEGDGFTDVSLVADSFTIVPEPSTYALFVGGAMIALLLLRKRTKAMSTDS